MHRCALSCPDPSFLSELDDLMSLLARLQTHRGACCAVSVMKRLRRGQGTVVGVLAAERVDRVEEVDLSSGRCVERAAVCCVMSAPARLAICLRR